MKVRIPHRRFMNNIRLPLTLLVAIGALAASQAAAQTTNLVPNGDFSIPGPSADWVEVQGGNFIYSYPTTGGNPNDYGIIDGTPPSTPWAIWVNGDTAPLSLASLGMTAGNPCTILMDMKVFSTTPGTNLGGFKIDFFSSVAQIGSTGDMRPSPAGHNVAAWETYNFPVTVPVGTEYVKLVPLWGPSSSVGYDNVRVVIPASIPLNASITSPLNGSTVGTNFTISVQASVAPGAITNIYFYDGATLLGSDDTAPYSYDVIGAALGAHALKVVAKADTGASVTSSVVNVTVSTAVIVTVNPSAGWSGFMNVSELPQNGGGYVFGAGWGTADLCATFSGSTLKLSPNVIGDPAGFWYVTTNSPSIGNKSCDASMYVQPSPSLPGVALTFTGTVISNTLTSLSNTNPAGNGWTCVAFIKDFAPDYSSSVTVTTPLTNGTVFSISLNTISDAARHVQYGFETVGPPVWATDPVLPSYGNVQIGPVVTTPTAPTITSSLSGGTLNLSFLTQTGFTYTVQTKTDLTNATWNTLTVTNGTGSTIVINTAASAPRSFFRLSVQ